MSITLQDVRRQTMCCWRINGSANDGTADENRRLKGREKHKIKGVLASQFHRGADIWRALFQVVGGDQERGSWIILLLSGSVTTLP